MLCGNGGEKLLLLAEGLLKKHVASHSLHEPEGGLCPLFPIFAVIEMDLYSTVHC